MSEDLQKVKTLLKVRGCSGRTVTTYISCINRFKNYFEGKDLENFNEEDILEYIKVNFVDLDYSPASINVNRAAIKYYYLVNLKKDLMIHYYHTVKFIEGILISLIQGM